MIEESLITRIEPKKKMSFFEWKEISAYRDLVYYLALRDIQLRYKQTSLGIIWVILQPLVPAVIFAVLFGNFAKLPSNGQPYMLLVFCGLIPWNILNGSISRAGISLVANANLLSKVYFPRIIMPISTLGSVFIDMLVSVGVLAVLMVFFQVPLTLNILMVPVFLVLAFLMGLGVSLIVSSLNVYYRDFSLVVPFALQIWNYTSPVVYSTELIPEKWRWLYALNPTTGLLEGFRWAVLGDAPLNTTMIITTVVFSALLLFIGSMVFRKVERGFADIV